MKDLVSVVVLVDNVESFINVSIDSILKQTYKNLEIILVDRGSKDNTLKICEYYAKKDRRVKLVEISSKTGQNSKNIGIKYSHGKYITFVDGGDILANNYIEYMLDKIKVEDADIVSIGSYKSNESKKSSRLYRVYEGSDILKNYLHMNLRSNYYAKLYKKSLFDSIKYPECKFYDDFMTTYKLYDKSKKVILSGLNKYCIVTDKREVKDDITDEERMKKVNACFEMLKFFEKEHPELVNYCKTKICYECISLFREVDDRIYRRQLYRYIKLYRPYAIRDKRFGMNKKSLCIRTMFGYHFMRLSFFLEKSSK